MNPSRILIIRLGSLGDIIHAIPVLVAIRRSLPDATVDWLVDRRNQELIDLVPGIGARLAVETRGASSIYAAVRALRRNRYDVALDLQGLLKSAVLARLSGAPRVVGFPAPLLRERAASAFYTETAGVARPHVIEKNLSMLKAVGIGRADIEFVIDAPETAVVAQARQRLKIGPGDRFALINPGAAWPNKRWPPVYFAEVARSVLSRHGLRSLVLWGPGEEQAAQTIAAASDGSAAVSPATSLADLFTLSRSAALMISGDTGPIHIAGAVGTPIVGIFGPTDPSRNGPWAEDDLTVSRYQACACHYERRCRISGWCLLDIAPREVMDLVERRLSSARAAHL